MDRESKDGKKKGKRNKVGLVNDSFELEPASNSVRNKVSPFLNNIRDVQSKNNNTRSKALQNLIDVRITASKWRDFVNRKRKRKKNKVNTGVRLVSGAAVGEAENAAEKRGTIGGLGLDDIHEDFVSGNQKLFGDKLTSKSMSSASNRALLQYFAKLGKSQKDDEVVDLDFVETLVTSGADINCTDRHGQTLLHEVASKWHTDVAKFLIDMNADVNKADNFGRTPLHVAAADNYPDMINVLIDAGAEKEALTAGELQTPVHYAARNDATDALKTLIKRHCKYKMVRDYKGRTPLHVAAELDRSETARLLLDLEAPAGVTDLKGQSVISWMITKMPPVAAEAIQQFHLKDRPNRKQYFYLNLLTHDRVKDPKFYTQMPLQVAVKYKQYDILTQSVMLTLTRIMWEKFARWRAYGSLLFNFVYIMLWTVYGVTIEYDERHLYKLPEHWWRIVLLAAAVGITMWQVIDEIREYWRSKESDINWKKWRREEIDEDLKYCHPRWPEEEQFLNQELQNLEDSNTRYFSDMWNWFDWFCYTLLVAVIGTHVADIVDHTDAVARAHIRLTAVVVIFLWLRLMKNIRAFSMLGPFVVMVGAMISDLLKFAFLYFEFYIPYLCAFWMIFGGNKYPEGTAGQANRTELTVDGFINFNEAMFSLWRMTLVDEYAYDEMKAIDPIMADILVGTWLFLSAVLCLNLLIALFSDTFQRVYDNARANAVMQKAVMILSFWEGMSPETRNKFLDHISNTCAPFKEYYDDDMTESDDADLKKVTIQIKEQLDEMKEKWDDQFGSGDDKTALEELQEEDLPKTDSKGKMMTTQKFESEIENLRDEIRMGLLELQKQQNHMMQKFKQDMKMVKSLILDLSGQGSGGQGGDGGGVGGGNGGGMGMGPGQYMQPADIVTADGMMMLPGYYQQMAPGVVVSSQDTTPRPHTGKKKKRKQKMAAGEVADQLVHVEDQSPVRPRSAGTGIFAPSPSLQEPIVEVSTQGDFSTDDIFSTDVLPRSAYDADHSTA
ncbi:uncharacterized protein LOC132760627 isoform X3 [Ruditapes philippinarum]|uniref:uncharacterized protein LOC132760627 isoform X3 n=1 Tax=Ruditapes philippinarum TaxID=129788 RepID=UPI00295A98B1|nr:uncharacterized protein LOC132760627 isoform X3 [Ruditapes philippinarum]